MTPSPSSEEEARELEDRFSTIDFAEHQTAHRERVKSALLLDRDDFLRRCHFADGLPRTFKVVDAKGEHDPCYVVLPGGSMLPLNHFADELTDVCRAIFIAEACNAALTRPTPDLGDVDERVQSSIEELDYIAGHEATPLVVSQAATRAKETIIALRAALDKKD